MQSTSLELNHTLVKAGAGAGKTRGLVEKVVDVHRLFRAQGQSPRIVLTTFTRKATQELKERLLTKACDLEDAALLQFVSDSSRLQISTIHGLLNLFLRQVGHLAGLESGFQVLNPDQVRKITRSTLRELLVQREDGLFWLQRYGFSRLLNMLKIYEQESREAGAVEPISLSEIESFAQKEFDRTRDLMLDFSATVLEECDETKWVEFAHSLKLFASAWSGGALEGLPSKVRRSAKTKPWEHLHERWDEIHKDITDRFDSEDGAKAWDPRTWPVFVEEWNRFLPLAEEFTQQVRQSKEATGQLEMADLELKTLEIIREHPELADLFARQWDFWMIDEYQDTSPVQVACLKALMGEQSKRYVVGDPQQSIYLFRGADVGVFGEALREIEMAQGEVMHLRTNFRSRRNLLLFINDFMRSVATDFSPMLACEASDETSRHPCAVLWKTSDAGEEMKAVVARVGDLLESGARLDEICVLGRTHDVLMAASRALKEFGYPTHVHSARGFSERREVLDALAIWKFLINPHDNLNLVSLLRSPWFYVPDHQLATWMEKRPASLWRTLEGLADVPEAVSRLRSCRGALREQSVAAVFEETLKSAGLLDLCLWEDPAGRKESNLWKLLNQARALSRESGQSLLDLAGHQGGDPLEASEGDATSAQEPNCINLMTIHGSKGLEFKHVLIPGCGQSPNKSKTAALYAPQGRMSFPIWDEDLGTYLSSPFDQARLEERRERELREFDRWLYVAVTRAKSSLTLLWSKVGKDSWASRSLWFSEAEGLLVREGFSVEVRSQAPETKNYAVTSKKKVSVRKPWRVAMDFGASVPTGAQSVSKLIEKSKFPMSADRALSRWRAQSTGIQIHSSLEALRYAKKTETEDEVSYVLGLQDPPIARILENGEAEWGFQVKTPKGVVEGQIDLWGECDDCIYVIDYKTGSERALEQAFDQLSLYAWALRRFGYSLPIELVVIYPVKQKFERRAFTEDLFLRWEDEFGRS